MKIRFTDRLRKDVFDFLGPVSKGFTHFGKESARTQLPRVLIHDIGPEVVDHSRAGGPSKTKAGIGKVVLNHEFRVSRDQFQSASALRQH